MIPAQEFVNAPSKAMADSAHKQKAKTHVLKAHLLAMSPVGGLPQMAIPSTFPSNFIVGCEEGISQELDSALELVI